MKEYKGFAKINLNLKVIGKDTNNFHFVEFLMTTINLYDSIYLSANIKDEVVVKDNPGLSTPENLAYKALQLMKKEYKIDHCYRIEIIKRIPISAGMAGGSTDAAQVINAVDELEKLNLTFEEKRKLAAQLGSDVPFCLLGKTAIATHYGEELTFLNNKVPACYVVVINPGIGLSTPFVYQNYRLINSETKLPYLLKNAHNFEEFYGNLTNDLTKSATSICPEINKIFEKLKSNQIEKYLLSGSGPTVLVFEEKYEDANQTASLFENEYDFVEVVEIRQ